MTDTFDPLLCARMLRSFIATDTGKAVVLCEALFSLNAILEQAALLEASVGQAEMVRRASVELCNNEAGQIYWTPSQRLDGMPLGTYIHTGKMK